MASRDWEQGGVSEYKQPPDATGSALHAKNKMAQQSREMASRPHASTKDKQRQLQLPFHLQERRTEGYATDPPRDQSHGSSETKSFDETPGSRSRGRIASRPLIRQMPAPESGFGTMSLSSRSDFESLYGGMESSHDKSKHKSHVFVEASRRERELTQLQVAGVPPSDGAESEEQSLATRPLMSLMKESSETWMPSGASLTSTSGLGTWTPPESFVMSPHQRALWEQTRPAASVVSESQETTSLPGVTTGHPHGTTLPKDYMLSHPASSVFEVSLPCKDEIFPDKVDGAALLRLSKEELVGQCRLRDKLLEGSEKHEKEMVDELNRQEDQAEAMKEENVRLKEKCTKLEEEIRQLKSRRVAAGTEERRVVAVAAGTEERTQKEKSKWGATAMLQMVTILYSCQIHDFSIQNMIAHGCEGAVFVARCMRQGSELLRQQVFALKVMFNIFSHSTFTKVRNFSQTEYQALCAMVPHPNIIRLYAFFYDRLSSDVYSELPPEAAENARTLSLFLVMEHIPKNLEQVAMNKRKEGKLTSQQVMQWTLDILTGIEHLLKHRYLHRDLKLNNILVSEEETLKLCDFGCSIQLQEDMKLLYAPGSSLGGNPAHMPPEVLNAVAGRHFHCGSQDLWACGVLVYEMAGGNSPLFGLDQQGYRMSDLPKLVIKNEKSGEVSEGSTIFPEAFCSLIFSLLEIEPSKRPSVHGAIETMTKLLR